MKLSLVVAQGVHTGKVIPITLPQFVIGRDPECQLRPASPAISKRHCAVLVRGGKVFVQDFGSTNGTFVNEEPVKGEVEVKDGDRLKAGPLDFTISLQVSAVPKPVPKAVPQPAIVGAGAPAEDEAVDIKVETKVSAGPESDKMAALLLDALDDIPGPAPSALNNGESVPDGSTVMELPSMAGPGGEAAKKKEAPKPAASTSSAAAEILKKYQRRPRT
jgi:predicted component of type VI protein secretion system